MQAARLEAIMPIDHRADRTVLKVSGIDAQKLLNNVLTGDFDLKDESAHWWALLSPQGKIQAEGLTGAWEGAFWLDLDAALAESFLKRMRLYKLRADVQFEDLRETARRWMVPNPA